MVLELLNFMILFYFKYVIDDYFLFKSFIEL